MAYPEADILVLGKEGIVKTDYKVTEHYLVMKSFINNPEGMLHQLLATPA